MTELERRIAQLSPEQRALLVRRLSARREATPARPPIPRREGGGDRPLSFAQQRLWFLDQLEPGSAAYNIPAALRFAGALDVAALERSLGEIVRRHEVLRACFPAVGGCPVQRAVEDAGFSLPVVDLSALPAREREAEVLRAAGADARRPFDLATGPVLRTQLLRLDAREHVLLIALHHIVSDAWSNGVLLRELATLYPAFSRGRPSPLAPLAIQYADYAEWEREQMQGEVLEAQLAYWKEQLAGPPPALELPTDRPRPGVRSGRGAHHAVTLPPALAAAARALGQAEGASLFMTLLAAFQALLHRYAGQEDLCVATPVAHRTRPEVEPLIGFFVNTLALRTDASGAPTFRELVGRVRQAALGGFAHQDVPFDMVVEALNPERRGGGSPLAQVMFDLEHAPASLLSLPELEVTLLEVDRGTSKFDLLLSMRDAPDGLRATFEYDTDLFDRATVARLAEHFQVLLEGALAEPGRPIAELPLLSQAERRRVLVEWNATARPLGDARCVHERVSERARAAPDALAVAAAGARLTYGELEARSDRLARRLRRLGIGREVPVALCLERSIETPVAQLAVLKAGGAFLPLDPSYPPDRLGFMVRDAGAPVVLAHARLASRLPAGGPPVLALDAALEEIAGADDPHAPAGASAPGDLAYVIYTSGSTGVPKGVEVEHHSLANLAGWYARTAELSPRDRVTLLAGPAFDACILELWPAMLSGASLHVVGPELRSDPERLRDWLVAQEITVAFLPTPVAELLMALPWPARPALRLVITGGDRLRAFPPRGLPFSVLNAYGPTEITVCATAGIVPTEPRPGARPSIGRPLDNDRVYVLDRRGQPVPIGVPGELHVGGAGVARGYRGRPDLTGERFVPDPFAGGNARMYRTGDLARWLPDGELDFLGRIDDQVKVRGFRIEPGEIEAALRRHPGVRDAAVTAPEAERGERRLVAYVVAADAARPPDRESLQRHLERTLPPYMVPASYVTLPALPVTPNGKVDRKALPPPEVERDATSSERPWTPAEELVAAVFCDVLALERVGRDESFFERGGHSLLATQAMSRLRAAFGVDVPLRVLFERPTISALAPALEEARSSAPPRAPPIARRPPGEDAPLSFAQQRLWFVDQIAPGNPQYNVCGALRLKGPLDVGALAASLDEVVRRHEALRTTFSSADGRPVQRMAPELHVPLATDDLSGAGPARQAREAALVTEEATRPFDLERGPLIRARLLEAGDDRLLVLTLHHAICDGWSLGVLVREVGALYAARVRGERSPLPELAIQYADYARWQRSWMDGELLEREVEHWRRALAGAPAALELPADRPRPALKSSRGARRAFRIDGELAAAVARLGRAAGATDFMTFLAVFEVLLHRYTGQEDLCVGTPIANRSRAETEGLIGLFVNTLVLRSDLSRDPTFRELLAQVREVALSAYAHQDVPFERVVDALQPDRSLDRTPLVQVMFALQAAPPPVPALPGVEAALVDVDTHTSKFDLSLELVREADGLRGAVEYDTDLFETATIDRFVAHYRMLLEAIAAHPGRPISELPLVPPEERRTVLLDWNATALDFPRDRCVHELFEEQAARTPLGVAVVGAGRAMTYRELDAAATALARRLRAAGVGPDVLVGLLAERRPETIVGLVGILKAGGAYVPLDPAHPPHRTRLVLEDARMPVVLAAAPPRDGWSHPGTELLVIEPGLRADAAEPPGAPLAGAARPEHLAYVIYTSGSTGRPKGVAITHRSAVNLWAGLEQAVYGGRREARPLRLSVNASFGFDASVQQILGLLGGHELHLVPQDVRLDGDALTAFVREHRLDVVDCVPTQLKLMLAAGLLTGPGWRPSILLPGGEPLDDATWQALAQARDVAVHNMYGPTECTVDCTSCRVSPAAARPSIGRPLANARTYVLDARREPVPVGVPGELWIGGAGLARGYVNRPELDAERFVPDPFAGEPGARMYRSGDRARWRADGTLEYLGRLDGQVKLRGFRIELGEVEAALAAHPTVKQSAAAVCEEGEARRLVAYVVPSDPGTPPEPAELRAFVKERLPDYMVPSAVVVLPALPLTPSGKLDRRALPAPEREARGDRLVAPRTEEEAILAAVWAEVLRLDRVGVDDDFFELGGDSILSIQVVSRARRAGLHVTPRQLFENPTVAALARVAERRAAQEPAREVPVAGPVPLTPVQARFFEQELPDPHHWNQSILLELDRALQREPLEAALRALVARHAALRLRFERGADGWTQASSEEDGAPGLLRCVDLAGESSPEARIEQIAAEVQASLDLSRGPIFRAVHFDLGPDAHARLLLVAHHLAVDGVSWRILLDDLQSAYGSAEAGAVPALPEEATSFRAWSLALGRLAGGREILDELPYWTAAREPSAPLPVDLPGGDDREALASTVAIHLDAADTRSLLQDLPRAQGTAIDDALLAALARSFQRWTGRSSLCVELEGHGREDIGDGLDLSGTVGWFTSAYPVWLDLRGARGPAEELQRVKETLRRVPRKGLGYGVLRYLCPDPGVRARLAAAAPPWVSFNYLGQVALPGPFSAAREARGAERSPRGRRFRSLEVNGAVFEGLLRLEFTFSTGLHRRETIEQLAGWYLEALREIVACGRSDRAGGYVPSDFPETTLSADELEAALDETGASEVGS